MNIIEFYLIGIGLILFLVIAVVFVLYAFYKRMTYSKAEKIMIIILLGVQIGLSVHDLWTSKDQNPSFLEIAFRFYGPFVIPLMILAIQSADSEKDKLKLKEMISEQADQQLSAFKMILNNKSKKELEDLESRNQVLSNKVTTLEAEKNVLINENKLLNDKLEILQNEANLTLEQIRNDNMVNLINLSKVINFCITLFSRIMHK